MQHIKGLVAAPFTPMNHDFSVNYGQIEKLAQYYHSQPLAGIFINGTTGESMSLTIKERIELANQWIKYAHEDFKVIVHVGHTSIEECKILACHAQKIGAYAIGAMGPCFFKPQTLDDLVEFCSEIAQSASELPFYYYHMPSMTGNIFQMMDFLKTADKCIPNLAGIKYTHYDLMDYRCCVNFEKGRFDILFGRDEILLAGLAMGASGAVGSTYNYAARLYDRIIHASNTGDIKTARQLQDQSIEIVKILRMPNAAELAVNKYVMNCFSGVDCGPTRSPVRNLTQHQKNEIKLRVSKKILIEM